MKTSIYNLIILDESGSMSCVRKQTIAGCNETLNVIADSLNTFAETQEHFVSIYAFQSASNHPSRYILKNVPGAKARKITAADYEPWGGTPLYDAVGSTLVDLKATIDEIPQSIGSVTIITDGYENSSTHYSREKVASLIEHLKAKGWLFNFIGANIDVEKVSKSLHIDNSLAFDQDEEGTKVMFERERHARSRYYSRMGEILKTAPDNSPSEEDLCQLSKGYFDEDTSA